MRAALRYAFYFLLLTGLFAAGGCRHRGAEPKEHQRMWKKWSKKSDAFNPYVKHGKATHEVSRQQKREDDKALKRAKKEYKKSIKRSARKREGK